VNAIYLDHAAWTPLRPGVREAMEAVSVEANPSSLHAAGREARAAIDRARAQVAGVLGVRPREVVFCSGGTEANVEALRGLARGRGRPGRLLIPAAEHSCVLAAADGLAGEGWLVETLPVDQSGRLEPDVLAAALANGGADIVSAGLVNNELGTINDVALLAELASAHGAVVHCDAVQAPGHLALEPRALGVDAFSLAAHKFGGPAGCGIMVLRAAVPFTPAAAGSQEGGRRPGTENARAIAGGAAALAAAEAARPVEAPRLAGLRDAFEAAVLAESGDARSNGAGAARIGSIASISFRGAISEELLAALDLAGVAVSAGSACAAGSSEPSHVLRAIGAPAWVQRGVVRFSFGHTTTERDAMLVAGMLPSILARLREQARAEVID
jgi:cysteine desulfurase